MVDYRVLLRLSFSPQLKSVFEKVKTELKEELQRASQDGDSCQDNQSELNVGGRGQGHCCLSGQLSQGTFGHSGTSPEVLVTG